MTSRLCLVIANLLLFILIQGCSEDAAQFDLTLSGESNCYTNQFPFEPSFFSVTPTDTGAMIRMERQKRTRTETDTVVIIVDTGVRQKELDEVDLSGQTFTLEPASDFSRVYFRFGESCEGTYLKTEVQGTLSFSQFGLDDGDVIEGTINGTLVDVFTADTPQGPMATLTHLGTLAATFSFEVRFGPQYTTFTSPPKSTRE